MPKIVDPEQKKKEIAEIAISVFAQNSLESATMQKIADAAGIAKGSIYKYFQSKEELVDFVLVPFMQDFESTIRNLENEAMTPIERLKLYLFIFIDAISPFEEVFLVFLDLWVRNIKGEYGNAKSKIERYFDLYRHKTTETIRQGQSQGLFKSTVDVEALAAYLVASLDGILIHYLYNKSTFDPRVVADTFFETVIDGLRAT